MNSTAAVLERSRDMSSLLTAALKAPVIGIALTGPYGDEQHYGDAPRKMRETYDYTTIPTRDAQEIILWKQREIVLSVNRKCAWRIALGTDFLSPAGVSRAAASMESILAAAREVDPLYVLMVEAESTGGPHGAPPNSKWFSPATGEGFELDDNVEASEPGTSLLFDLLEVVNPAVPLRWARYAVYDRTGGSGESLSKGSLSPSRFRWPGVSTPSCPSRVSARSSVSAD